jgi:hypothetical protein
LQPEARVFGQQANTIFWFCAVFIFANVVITQYDAE